MSLTGYERKITPRQTFSKEDKRLDPLRKLSHKTGMTIIVSAPLNISNSLYIGSFILFPDKSMTYYTKQFLHEGEEEYFSSSFQYNPQLKVLNENFSLAICFDISNPIHPENAYKINSSFYLASIFYTMNSISSAHNILLKYAKKYSLNILMSNYCGTVWGLKSGGQSAFWSNEGKCVVSLNNSEEGLLLIEKNNSQWSGHVIKF